MRILVVVPSLHGGGAEFVARTWASWWAQQGHDVHVHTTAEGPRPQSLSQDVGWHGGRRGNHLMTQLRLRTTVRALGPDVIVALQMYANLQALLLRITLGRGASARCPVVVSERNLVSIGLVSAAASHRAKVTLAKRLYRTANHVAAISHPVAAEMISAFGVDPQRCTVVPNPACAKVTAPADHGDPVTPDDGRIVVVFPCRLVTQKRPELAVDVVAELTGRGHRASLLVFGAGPLEAALRERADGRSVDVTFGGWQEEWFAWCPRGSVLLLPSTREGFGNTLVEAAAAGLRSVAYSGALGVADAVVPGVTGTLTASDTVSAFADAVEEQSGRSVTGADEWLLRFTPAASGAAMMQVLLRATGDST